MLQGPTITVPVFFLRFILLTFISCYTTFVQAQLCNGSLGDPVVNINFGTGGGTGFPPASGYTYTSSFCPDDGFYTVTTRTSGCFGNSWLTVNNDHTGGGAFMLVNASFTPGDFFLTTVTDLCPNTTYEFAAWLMNVMGRSGIKPNLTFSIETPGGTILQQYSSGDIPETPSPVWKQYGFYFTTPVNNPVIVLRIKNNAPGGNGNDLALDDITFRPCGPAFITATIQGNSDTVDICEGNTNQYTINGAVSSGYVNPVYQWQVSIDSGAKWTDLTNANTLNYLRLPSQAGSFWYRLTVTELTAINYTACRIASGNVIINVHAKPVVNAGPDKIVFFKDSVTLDATVTGENPQFFWDPPDYLNSNNQLNPTASPPSDFTYSILATTQFGCSNKDDVKVKVVAGIFIPNAFTPNNDGLNDSWRIPFLYPQFGAVVNVFNRLGQLVYHTKGGIVEWDGTFKGQPQSPGTYVYQISYNKGKEVRQLKGSFLLIR